MHKIGVEGSIRFNLSQAAIGAIALWQNCSQSWGRLVNQAAFCVVLSLIVIEHVECNVGIKWSFWANSNLRRLQCVLFSWLLCLLHDKMEGPRHSCTKPSWHWFCGSIIAVCIVRVYNTHLNVAIVPAKVYSSFNMGTKQSGDFHAEDTLKGVLISGATSVLGASTAFKTICERKESQLKRRCYLQEQPSRKNCSSLLNLLRIIELHLKENICSVAEFFADFVFCPMKRSSNVTRHCTVGAMPPPMAWSIAPPP